MKVIEIKKKGKKYQITFDNEISCLWHEDVIIKYQIFKPKIAISEDKFQIIVDDNNYYLALEQALQYLSAIHSTKQVETYLRKKYNDIIVGKVINYLKTTNYLNEREYARAYLMYCYHKDKGPNFVKENLITEGISSSIIEDVLIYYTEEMERNACEKAFLKQLATYKKESLKSLQQKMTIFLTNRGFNRKMIAFSLANNQRLLDNIIDEEKLIEKAYDKCYRQYAKKYSGRELNDRITRSLYSKGFSLDKIKNTIESREEK